MEKKRVAVGLRKLQVKLSLRRFLLMRLRSLGSQNQHLQQRKDSLAYLQSPPSESLQRLTQKVEGPSMTPSRRQPNLNTNKRLILLQSLHPQKPRPYRSQKWSNWGARWSSLPQLKCRSYTTRFSKTQRFQLQSPQWLKCTLHLVYYLKRNNKCLLSSSRLKILWKRNPKICQLWIKRPRDTSEWVDK